MCVSQLLSLFSFFFIHVSILNVMIDLFLNQKLVIKQENGAIAPEKI